MSEIIHNRPILLSLVLKPLPIHPQMCVFRFALFDERCSNEIFQINRVPSERGHPQGRLPLGLGVGLPLLPLHRPLLPRPRVLRNPALSAAAQKVREKKYFVTEHVAFFNRFRYVKPSSLRRVPSLGLWISSSTAPSPTNGDALMGVTATRGFDKASAVSPRNKLFL